MKKYEAVIIVVPEAGEEGLQKITQKFSSLVDSSGGSVEVSRSLGKRLLAYRIGPYQEGVYILTQFSCNPSAIDNLRRELLLSEQIIRSMIVRREEGVPVKEEAVPGEEEAPGEVAIASEADAEQGEVVAESPPAREVAASPGPQTIEGLIPNAGPSPELPTPEGGEEGAE